MPFDSRALVATIFAAALACAAIWQLEGQRAGLEITTRTVGETPVTRTARPGRTAPWSSSRMALPGRGR